MMAEFFFIINPLAFLCKSEKKFPTVRANLHVYEFLRIMHCGTNCWAWNSNVTAYYIITAKKQIIDKNKYKGFLLHPNEQPMFLPDASIYTYI